MQWRMRKQSRGVDFRARVLAVVARIPRGTTMSYGGVAARAGAPGAYRAVGNIMAKNRDPRVPCHRVIRSDLPAPRPEVYFIYAILCDDDSIYIGQTQDLQKRWRGHVDGTASSHTKKHKPLKLIHYERYSSRERAVQREKNLKTGFGRKWLKREWIAGRLPVRGTQTGTRQAGGTVGGYFGTYAGAKEKR